MKLKYLIPALTIIPLCSLPTSLTSCKTKEKDLGPAAKKIEFTEYKDGDEIDVHTTPFIQLKAKITDPEKSTQSITYSMIHQDGAGKLACSITGKLNTNNSVGTCQIKAISEDKQAAAIINLRFYDSSDLIYTYTEREIAGTLYKGYWLGGVRSKLSDIEYVVIPSKFKPEDSQEYLPVFGTNAAAFNGARKLKYVLFPNDEKFIDIAAYSFEGCTSLKTISIPDSVYFIEPYAFGYCFDLAEVKMSEKINAISEYAFYNCSDLTKIDLPDSLTLLGEKAFSCCDKLKSIHLGPKVKTIEEAVFSNCRELDITVDENNPNFKHIQNGNSNGLYTKDGKRMLTINYGSDINDFVVPDSVTEIDGECFSCSKIKSVKIPSSVDSIGDLAFSYSVYLENIEFIGESSLLQIGWHTFAYCGMLKQFTIPKNVVMIEVFAFYGCSSLEKITFADTNYKWNVYDPEKPRTEEPVHKYENNELANSVQNVQRLTGINTEDEGYSAYRWFKA